MTARNRVWREKKRDAVFPPSARMDVLTQVSNGKPLGEALRKYGMSTQSAYGRCQWDPVWKEALHDAQMKGRDPYVTHGIPSGYMEAGCRCPECRATQPGCRPLETETEK